MHLASAGLAFITGGPRGRTRRTARSVLDHPLAPHNSLSVRNRSVAPRALRAPPACSPALRTRSCAMDWPAGCPGRSEGRFAVTVLHGAAGLRSVLTDEPDRSMGADRPGRAQTAPLRLTTSSYPVCCSGSQGRNAANRVSLPNSPHHHAGASAAGMWSRTGRYECVITVGRPSWQA